MKKFEDRPTRLDGSLTTRSGDGLTRSDPDGAGPEHSTRHSRPAAVPTAPAGTFERKILMSSLNGIYVYDLAIGRNTLINPQYTRLTGYTLEDFQTQSDADFLALVYPEDQDRVADHLERIGRCDDDEVLEIEYRYRTADGRWIWCLSRDTVLERDGSGAVRRILGTFLDITGRKTAEGNLAHQRRLLKEARNSLATRVSERTLQLEATVTALKNEIQIRKKLVNQLRRWSRVFMDAADPIIIENLTGTIIDMNHAAEREYSWKRGELIGKSICSLIPPEHHQWAERLRECCRRGEEVRNLEGMRQDQHGRIFTVLLAAFPLQDDSGNITSLATIAKDISLRKQMESELEKTRRHLRELSRKSIEVLENDRRTTAKELHDSIGASLAAIKFRLEGIAEEMGCKPENAAASLSETISYLQAAITETRQISARLRPTILDDLGLLSTITWYTRQLSQQFGHAQLIPRIEIREADIPEVLKIVIYRVLQECLNNAAKHSDASEIKLNLKRDAHQVIMQVADNGCGFDVQHTLGSQDPMSGYGLASMVERAEIAGGSLIIDSSPGNGTRIEMRLPLTPGGSNMHLNETVPN